MPILARVISGGPLINKSLTRPRKQLPGSSSPTHLHRSETNIPTLFSLSLSLSLLSSFSVFRFCSSHASTALMSKNNAIDNVPLSRFGVLVAQLESIVASASQKNPDPLLCFEILSDLISALDEEPKVSLFLHFPLMLS